MNLSYMEIRNAIEKAVPDTTDLDYNDISYEALQENIEKELDKINFFQNVTAEQSIEFWQHIAEKHKAILAIGASTPNYASVKSIVLEIRNYITAKASEFGFLNIQDAKANLLLDEKDQIYGDNFGSIEEIELLIHPDNIKEYLEKEFYMLFAQGSIEITPKIATNIYIDLCNHFGIKLNEEQHTKVRGCINWILNSIADDCRNHKVIDSKRIDYHAEELSGLIRDYCYWAYNRKQIIEKAKEFDAKEEALINMGKTTPIETKEDNQPTKEVSLDEVKAKLENLKVIVKNTEELVAIIDGIDKQISDLKNQIASLEAYKASYLNQLNDFQNNSDIVRE